MPASTERTCHGSEFQNAHRSGWCSRRGRRPSPLLRAPLLEVQHAAAGAPGEELQDTVADVRRLPPFEEWGGAVAEIFDDRKRSFRELRRLHRAGELNEHAARLWAEQKPVEELYDLSVKQRLAGELKKWILEHRDSGFLPEAEYQIRAAEAGLTPFDIVQNPQRFDLPATLAAAWHVGDKDISPDALTAGLHHDEAGVRYWSAVALQAQGEAARAANVALLKALEDTSPSVRIAAAEALIATGNAPPALDALAKAVQDDRPWVALQAARALAMAGDAAKPLVPVMKAVIDKNRSAPGSRRPYKDFNYASFTGWALETALAECGEPDYVE